MRIARPLIAKRDDAKPAARCMDTADRAHPNCWAACTLNTARHARVAKRGAATTKAAHVDDACRRTAFVTANLAAPCIARRRHFHDGLMRRWKAGRIFDDASRGRHERRGARQPRPNACAADNGGHRLTVEFDVVCEIVDEKLGHDVFAAKVERLAGAMIRRALAGVVRCAEVSSHYEYRKSVFNLPARFTNARLVPDLFKVPNKSYGAFMDKACSAKPRVFSYPSKLRRARRVVAFTRQPAALCWTARDKREPRIARGNPGLRKNRPGASIEAAHVTGYDSFPNGRQSLGRTRSGLTATAAIRTTWLALRV